MMMYYKEVLKGIRAHRKALRILARKNNLAYHDTDDAFLQAYLLGRRDAYADSASRANDLIDCYEVR